jgi:hypothetical protein
MRGHPHNIRLKGRFCRGRPKRSKTIQLKSKATVEQATVSLVESGEISKETATLQPLGGLDQGDAVGRRARPVVASCELRGKSRAGATVKRDAAMLSDDELLGILAADNAKPAGDTPRVH